MKVVSLYTYFRGVYIWGGGGEKKVLWDERYKISHGILSKIHQYHTTSKLQQTTVRDTA